MNISLNEISQRIRSIPDFPKPGILFRDITPVLKHAESFKALIGLMAERYRAQPPTQIVAVESRGFIFGSALAYELGCGLVIVRKPGKLPAATIKESYALEYGQDTLEMHADAISAGDDCVLVDDLLATGGTAAATARLVERLSGKVRECLFVVELTALQGRQKLNCPVHALLSY
jgi:adenine phosphoribosyltransferase